MKYKKLISIILSLCFSINQALYAIPERSAKTHTDATSFSKKTFNLNCDIGNVDKYHEGNRSLANIILIQDIHCDFSAQYNISKIIDHLSRFYKTNRNINRSLVLIEGDSGKISLDFFSSFPDPETRKNVFASFMKRDW